MNGAMALSLSLLLTACATVRPAAPTGPMWAFFADLENMSGPRLVMYAPERRTCEEARGRFDKGAAGSRKVPRLLVPSECRQTVVGAGAQYWVFASYGAGGLSALGWSGERAHCMNLRAEAQRQTGSWDLGECQPVAMELGPLVLGPVVSSGSACAGDNTLPMFGYDPGHRENPCDVAFIENVTRDGKSRSQASREVANIGWAALRANDLDKAIKRFNQAWLLDKQNAHALWGFGVWEALKEKPAKAEEFLRQALAIETADPGLYVDLGRTVTANGAQSREPAKLREARALFASAKAMNQRFVPAYVQEAVLDLQEEKYAEAWTQVLQAEKIDPHGVDPELVSELEKRMPRPAQ